MFFILWYMFDSDVESDEYIQEQLDKVYERLEVKINLSGCRALSF